MEIYFEEPLPEDNGRHELDPDTALSIPLDAPALETIQDENGDPEDVIARVRSISEHGNSYQDGLPASELLVIRGAGGRLHFRAVDQFKHTIRELSASRRYRSKPTTIQTGTGAPNIDIQFTRPENKKGAPTLHISKPLTGSNRLRVTTAPEAATEELARTVRSTASQHNKQRKQRRIRRWLAGLALVHAANTSGGAIDIAEDIFSDAGTVVEQDVSIYQNGSPEEKQAVSEVARTMKDLDDHNYDAILQRAEAFKEQNKDQFMPDAKLKAFQSRIESAKSHDEIIKTVDEFMHFYGKTAGVQSTAAEHIDAFNPANISLDTFRAQTLGILDAYSFLPKKYVEESYFKKLVFSGALQADAGFEAAGHYELDKDIIRVVATDGLGHTRDEAEATTQHETAHAKDTHIQPFEESKDAEFSNYLGYALDWMIESPADVSPYAAANSGTHNEPYAESAEGVLSGENNLLAHPDNARRFSSDANKQLISYMIEFDQEFPGSSDYIVAHSGVIQRGGPWPVVLMNRYLSRLAQ